MSRSGFRPYQVKVISKETLSPSLVRVSFEGEELELIGPARLDQRIKVFFPENSRPVCGMGLWEPNANPDLWYAKWKSLDPAERTPFRTYTLLVNSNERLDLLFVDHGPYSPAGRWLASVKKNEQTVIIAPDITVKDPPLGIEWRPQQQDRYLIVGDETALPAILGIMREVTAEDNREFYALVEMPCQEDILPWGAKNTFSSNDILPSVTGKITRRHLAYAIRGQKPVGDSLRQALAEWVEPEDKSTYVWLAGESGVITGIRRWLTRELGWPKKNITFTGYWKQGVSEN